jgi:hypothetical protein
MLALSEVEPSANSLLKESEFGANCFHHLADVKRSFSRAAASTT